MARKFSSLTFFWLKLSPLAVLVFIAFFAISSANAAQYNCDGMIQYRPCGQKLHQYKRKVRSESPTAALARPVANIEEVISDDKFARVLSKSYKRVAGQEGLWRGTIEGNGLVHLYLNFLRDGAVTTSRYMGQVALKNKSTWFSFKTATPAGRDWTWDIQAFAK